MGARRSLFVAAIAASSACASLSGLAGGQSDAGADALADGAADAGTADDAARAEEEAAVDAFEASGGDAGACPGRTGTAGVRIDAYCIDSTEVTNAQYAAFLSAVDGDAGAQQATCAWNVSLVPVYGWPPAANEGNLPVVGVDYCDARAYCAWAGKRLCGRIGGGDTLHAGEGNDPSKDEWYRACSRNGLHAYPYGDIYDAALCNGTSAQRAPVGSYTGCAGGYPGIFDMSGNVEEWEDLCDPDPNGGGPESDLCRVRGGGSQDSPVVLSCTSTFAPRRDYAIAYIGFRCCAP